jgi:GlpG protein
MRQIGKLPTEADVVRFTDYLLSQGITTTTDAESGAWAIWVHDEDRIAQAREELAAYLKEPHAPRFQEAARAAAAVREEAARKEREYRKNVVDMRRRWQRGSGPALVTWILIGISVAVGAATGFKDGFTPFSLRLLIDMPALPGAPVPVEPLALVRHGEVWRLVTPIFLHFGILHLLFNMLWLEQLGTTIESRLRSPRFLLLVLVMAIGSNLAQYAVSGPVFGGMSGVVYGLFGYVWMKSRYEPESGMFLSPNTVFWMIGWLVLCTVGVIPHAANAAHAAGLGLGVLLGAAPVAWKRR